MEAETPRAATKQKAKTPRLIMQPIALKADEAAAALGISLSSFKRYVRPDLPRIHVGESIVLYRISDLESWMAKHVTELPPL